MRYVITADQLRAIADMVDESFGEGDLEDNLRTDYSGRYMYGKECLAYVGSNGGMVRFAIAAYEVLGASLEAWDKEDLMGALSDYASDSMGHDGVYYWPHGEISLDDEATAHLRDLADH